ncbi:sensor histidine kinase [Ferruginibacter sp.]
MHSLYHILLQVPASNIAPAFVLKAGLLVILLVFFTVSHIFISRRKSNQLFREKKLLKEQFNTALLRTRLQVQQDTFASLGGELHDNIGQLLSTAKMFIGITERELAEPPLTLLTANETLDKAIRELRDLSRSLNTDNLQEFDLYKNLAADIRRINSAGAFRIKLHCASTVLPAVAEQQFILYRLLQEGIQNVIKHAAAKNLYINISHYNNSISATLRDDGKGFNIHRKASGIGIKMMRQRARILGGKIEWRSSVKGTQLHIVFPVKTAEL